MKQDILVLNYEFPPLGWWAGPVSYDISKWYVDAGYNVDVVTMWFKDLPEYEVKDWIHIYRVKCWRLKKEVCHPWEQLTYLVSWYFKLKELLKEKKYGLCHCHFLVPTGILALILKKEFWLKYIITSHWSDVPWHNPDRFKFLHKFTPGIIKSIINNSEMVFAPSQYLSDLIKERIKWLSKEIVIIPNWVDIEKYYPIKKERIILWVWRLHPLKGLHLLAEAFSEIENVNWYELHICWDWPLMNKLKKIQEKSKNKIVLHWWIDSEKLGYKSLFWKARIFCLPSVAESWSLSLLEWMASWCAVMWVNKSATASILRDAWIYIEPTLLSIWEELELLVHNDNFVENMWKRAREKVEKSYDKKKLIKKYSDLLEF